MKKLGRVVCLGSQISYSFLDWDRIPSPTMLEDEDCWAEILSSLKPTVKYLLISSCQSFAACFGQQESPPQYAHTLSPFT